MFGYLRLPTALATWFPSLHDGVDLRLTFAWTAVLAICQGFFLIFGLKIKPDPTSEQAAAANLPPDDSSEEAVKPTFGAQVVHAVKELPLGFVLARRDAQIALSFGAAFAVSISRGCPA